jgi:hypothetical protein
VLVKGVIFYILTQQYNINFPFSSFCFFKVEILDGLKADVADNNADLHSKKTYDAELTEKTETDTQKIGVMRVTQSEKEAMVAQLEAAGWVITFWNMIIHIHMRDQNTMKWSPTSKWFPDIKSYLNSAHILTSSSSFSFCISPCPCLISVENTEQIAELEDASTQLAAELDEVLKTIEESKAKIDKYTSERAGQKSAVPPKK